ncbi:CocE/NonD family hydrolase [Thermodesulfobacteriota bacterium]
MKSFLSKDFPKDKLSKPEYGVKIEKDVFITMRDGVKVCVDVYMPDAPGKFPALFACSCYQKDLVHLPAVTTFHMRETNDIDWFVSRGYVYVNADIRGTGKSEGVWKFHSVEEQGDLYDITEWIAAQAWCTGRVGMIGESYYAWTQWFAAATVPPHLVTIIPWDGGADMYRDVVFHGGLLGMGFLTWWHFNLRANHTMDLPEPRRPDIMDYDLVYHVLKHPTYDDFWKIRSVDFSKIKCSVYSIGVWHKVGMHLRGNIRGFEEIDVPKKLLVVHGDLVGEEMAIFNSIETRLEMLRWYDHWLKDNDTGIMDEKPVKLFIRNSDYGYREENEWPLKRTEYSKFYLAPGPTGAIESLNDGGLSREPPTAEDSSFEFAYPDPEWSGWSGIGTAKFINGLPNPAIKILTFCTNPLEEDLELTGNITLNLYASSDQTDMDFYVRLVDEYPDEIQQKGVLPPKAKMLTRGWLKASHREKDETLSSSRRPYYCHTNPKPIKPGKIYKFEIEIWSTSNLFKKGHRIRLDISNGDSPGFDLGGHHFGLKVGKDTIYHDKGHPSYLVLPVIQK